MTEPDVIVLVKEREKRAPKEGDAYIRETGRERGQIDTAKHNFSFPRTCYTRHDLNVPEGAEELKVQAFTKGGAAVSQPSFFPLPRPKVKRYQWRVEYVAKKIWWRTEERYSEEEIRAAYGSAFPSIHPILETEVSE